MQDFDPCQLGRLMVKWDKREGGVPMKKREAAIALSLLSLVSAACLKGMKAIGEKMEREKEKRNHAG